MTSSGSGAQQAVKKSAPSSESSRRVTPRAGGMEGLGSGVVQVARGAPQHLSRGAITRLQRTVGNQAVQRIIGGATGPSVQRTAVVQRAGTAATTTAPVTAYFDEAVIDALYQKELYKPVSDVILDKFGVGRSALFRSKELNAFRQSLKDAAREQAAEDIAKEAEAAGKAGNTKLQDELSRKYYGMKANKEAYKTSKVSVDEIMQRETEEILKEILKPGETKQALKDAAAQAGANTEAALRAKKKIDPDTVLGAGHDAAKSKAKALFKIKSVEGEAAARAITKGDKATKTGPNAAKQQALAQSVKAQVTKDEVAKKALKTALEAPNMGGGLAKIGALIDTAVPNPGDGVAVEIELKIPIPTSGGAYFLFGFAGEAEREKDELTVSTELTFGAGFETFGLDANFRAGFFLEAEGANSEAAMNLMSYGMYRQMRNFSTRAAEYFWGEGGGTGGKKSKTGLSAAEEAELWAAMVEQRYMTDEGGAVSVGGMAKAKAEINAKVVEAEGELGFKRLRKYDKKIIEELTGGKFGAATDLNKAALAAKASAADKGEQRTVIEGAAEATAKWFAGQSLTFGLEGSVTIVNGTWRELEIKAKGGIPFKYGDENSQVSQFAGKVVPSIAGGVRNLIGIIKNRAAKAEDEKKRAAGSLMDTATDGFGAGTGLAGSDSLGDSFVNSVQKDETINDTIRGWLPGQDSSASAIEKVGANTMETTLELELGGEVERDENGTVGDWEISLALNQVKKVGIELDFGGAGIKAEIEKSKRLGKISFGSEGFGAEGLGFDTKK
jgi:hypothetical protein